MIAEDIAISMFILTSTYLEMFNEKHLINAYGSSAQSKYICIHFVHILFILVFNFPLPPSTLSLSLYVEQNQRLGSVNSVALNSDWFNLKQLSFLRRLAYQSEGPRLYHHLSTWNEFLNYHYRVYDRAKVVGSTHVGTSTQLNQLWQKWSKHYTQPLRPLPEARDI